jgi:hypothetical protein
MLDKSLPRERMLLSGVFADETVEFSFANLQARDRESFENTCFPSEHNEASSVSTPQPNGTTTRCARPVTIEPADWNRMSAEQQRAVCDNPH